MRIYHSLFPDNFVRQFPGWETADEHITLYDYRANYVGVEQMLSACHTLWPPIIEDEGGVFVRRSYLPQVMQELRTKFGGDMRHVERWLNA